ncbi:MAG: amidohydrolase family protein [bacterium]|jgi:5-methylthioadenosine/S-adenosylhomocysteine deaminase
MKTLIKNAHILTMDDAMNVYENGVIEIADGKITHVGPAATNADSYFNTVIDAAGRLVTPGLHNAHTHSPSNVIKAVYDLAFHAIGMWYIHAWTVNRTPEEIRTSTLLGCVEMLKTGAIGCIDHSPVTGSVDYLPGGGADIDPIAEAYLQAKMKAAIAISITDHEYSDIIPVDKERIDADFERRIRDCFAKPLPVDTTMELCEASIRKWHGHSDKLQIMLGPTSPLRCSREMLQAVRKMADEHGIGVHTHVLESKVQAELMQRRHGQTMVEMLDDIGLLTERFSGAHTIWVTDDDIRRLGERKVSAVHNVGSNLRGSAGVSPVHKLLQAGCNVGLGADGSSSNGSQNMFTLTRLALAVHRIGEANMDKWLTTQDIMRMVTRNGAKAALLGRTSGTLEAGKQADLVLYDINSVWLTPLNDPYRLLAWCDNGSSVDTVLIDGEVAVENGKVLTVDAEQVKKDAREMVRAIPIRNREIFRVIEEITPILAEEHKKRFAAQ